MNLSAPQKEVTCIVSNLSAPIEATRTIISWNFEGGGFVMLLCGKVSTKDALDKIDEMIAIKRTELALPASPTPKE